MVGDADSGAGLENRRVAREVGVVVKRGGLIGVDVPSGDAGDLRRQAVVGESVVEGARLPVEEIRISAFFAAVQVLKASAFDDRNRVFLGVAVEVAASCPGRRPDRRRGPSRYRPSTSDDWRWP